MKRIFKSSIAAAMVAATAASTVPAQAGDGWHRHDYRRPIVVERNSGAELLAAGVLGLAAGALVGSALAQQPQPVYREPAYRHPHNFVRPSPDRHYFPPAPHYVTVTETVTYEPVYATFEPWTPEWYRYCENRYRSFDPATGTFLGYDGIRHFCEAN